MPKKPKWYVDEEIGLEEVTGRPIHFYIRDRTTDNLDIVAEVPLTGDEDYDREVTAKNADELAKSPEYRETLEDLRVWLVAPDLSKTTIAQMRKKIDAALKN